jgi:hypothetical protein
MCVALKHFSHRLLVGVMLLALGTAPLVVQSVAWGLMLVEYSRTSTFTTAVEMTFGGEHPCSLCHAVQKQQKEGEKKQQASPVARDLVLYHVAEAVCTRPVETFKHLPKRRHDPAFLVTRTQRPPLPPPRLCA